jgi:hypothetical protein
MRNETRGSVKVFYAPPTEIETTVVARLFNRLDEPPYRINSCERLSVTNLAYGGPGNTSLFITESDTGTILRAEAAVAGHVLSSHL